MENVRWSHKGLLPLQLQLHVQITKQVSSDWEPVKTKYCNIHRIFIERYPKDGNKEQFSQKDPIIRFTKERLTAKVKALRTKIKVALASGEEAVVVVMLPSSMTYVQRYGEGVLLLNLFLVAKRQVALHLVPRLPIKELIQSYMEH